jgi:hypothetical protein
MLNRSGNSAVRGCMKCHAEGKKKLCRMTHGRYRRFLEDGDPKRTDPRYGEPECGLPPKPRTHAEYVGIAIRAERAKSLARDKYYTKWGPCPKKEYSNTHFSDKLPVEFRGVCGRCAFTRLPYFDIVRDMRLDIMHINKAFTSNVIAAARNSKPPTDPAETKQKRKRNARTKAMQQEQGQQQPQEEKKLSAAKQREVDQRARNFIMEKALFADNKQKLETIRVTEGKGIDCDRHVRSVIGPPGFIGRVHRLWSRPGALKAVDWQRFTEYFANYTLYMAYADRPMIFHVIVRLLNAVGVLLRRSISVAEAKAGRLELILAFIEFERVMPLQLHLLFPHALIHWADEVCYTGPQKAYWLYPFERYVGWMKRMISSRMHPELNMLNSYSMFNRSMPAGTREHLLKYLTSRRSLAARQFRSTFGSGRTTTGGQYSHKSVDTPLKSLKGGHTYKLQDHAQEKTEMDVFLGDAYNLDSQSIETFTLYKSKVHINGRSRSCHRADMRKRHRTSSAYFTRSVTTDTRLCRIEYFAVVSVRGQNSLPIVRAASYAKVGARGNMCTYHLNPTPTYVFLPWADVGKVWAIGPAPWSLNEGEESVDNMVCLLPTM